MVAAGHGHDGQQRVGAEEGGDQAQVLELCVSAGYHGLQQHAEGGDDRLQDGDDGEASLTDECGRVEVGLFMIVTDSVKKLGVEQEQVLGEHADGGGLVFHFPWPSSCQPVSSRDH